MSEAYAFNSKDDLDRVLKAARNIERLMGSNEPQAPPTRPPGAGIVIVEVTGDSYEEDPYPVPFDDFISIIDLYPGLFRYRDTLSTSSADKWYDYASICYVEGLNSGLLVKGKRYTGTVVGYRNGIALVEVNDEEATPSDPNLACPVIRLPCFSSTSGNFSGSDPGGGGLPCYVPLSHGIAFIDCTFPLPSDGDSGDPTGFDGGAKIVCNGHNPVTIPRQLQITTNGGTRSFLPVGEKVTTSTRNQLLWPISIETSNFRINGALTYCCNTNPPGLYFEGNVASSYNDPLESSDSGNEWCGCARTFVACKPCAQTITHPSVSSDTVDQTLTLDVGCGSINLVIEKCPDPIGWSGPGFYWVVGSNVPLSIHEGEQCGIEILCGPFPDYTTAINAYNDCFGQSGSDSSGSTGFYCCKGKPPPTSGSVTIPISSCGLPTTATLQVNQTGGGTTLGSFSVSDTNDPLFGAGGFIQCTPLVPGGWWSQLGVANNLTTGQSYPAVDGEFISAACRDDGVDVTFVYHFGAPCFVSLVVIWHLYY